MAYRSRTRSPARRAPAGRAGRKSPARRYGGARSVSRGRSAPSRRAAGGVLKIVVEQRQPSVGLADLLGLGGQPVSAGAVPKEGRKGRF